MNLTSKQLELVELLKGTLPSAPAEVAQANVEWYRKWQRGEKLEIGDRRWSLVDAAKILFEVYAPAGDNLYPPEQVSAVWKRVFLEEWPEWIQPQGAGTGYAFGAKVSHNGKKWISEYEGENVWEPGVYGWIEAEV